MLCTSENARKSFENRPSSYLQDAYRGAPDPTSKVEVNPMSRNNARQNGQGAADGVVQLEWTLRFRDGVETVWLWQVQGAPPLDLLAPIRTPRSSASNRHIPVSAYTFTNSGVVHLESGLEHDLVRMLDRDSTVLRIIFPTVPVVMAYRRTGYPLPRPIDSAHRWERHRMGCPTTRKAGRRLSGQERRDPSRLPAGWMALHGVRRNNRNGTNEHVVAARISPQTSMGNAFRGTDTAAG
ncbi:hypothetical protein MYSE111917_02835 [Mycobacterium senriense]